MNIWEGNEFPKSNTLLDGYLGRCNEWLNICFFISILWINRTSTGRWIWAKRLWPFQHVR
jgi:hypothetical protein